MNLFNYQKLRNWVAFALAPAIITAAVARHAFAGPGFTVISITSPSHSYAAGEIDFEWTQTGTGGSFSANYVGSLEIYEWNSTTSTWDDAGSGQDTTSSDYYETWTVAPSSSTNVGLAVNVADMGLSAGTYYAARIDLYLGSVSTHGATPVGSAWTVFAYDGDDPPAPPPTPYDPPPQPEPPIPPYPGPDPPIDYPLAPPSGPAGPGSFPIQKFTP